MEEYREGDTVEVLRGSGTWQPAVVVTSYGGEVVVQWGRWKKRVPVPSKFLRRGDTPLPSTVGGDEDLELDEGCGHCGKMGGLLYPCTGCHAAVYCNETCQGRAWGTHRFECPGGQYVTYEETPFPAEQPITDQITSLFPHLEIGVAVEACGYSGERAQFNGLGGVITGYQDQKVLVQFHLRNGVVLAITPHHLRPSHPPSPSYPLGVPVAIGSVSGAVGYVVGYRGALLLVEIDGKQKGVFPIRTEDAFLVTRTR